MRKLGSSGGLWRRQRRWKPKERARRGDVGCHFLGGLVVAGWRLRWYRGARWGSKVVWQDLARRLVVVWIVHGGGCGLGWGFLAVDCEGMPDLEGRTLGLLFWDEMEALLR